MAGSRTWALEVEVETRLFQRLELFGPQLVMMKVTRHSCRSMPTGGACSIPAVELDYCSCAISVGPSLL